MIKNINFNWLVLTGCIVTGITVFLNCLENLWLAWQSDEYSHGLLIPLISLGWSLKILQNSHSHFNYSWFGIPVVIISLSLNYLGILVSNHWLSNIGLVVFVIGIVTCFIGLKGAYEIKAPLILLFFAVPLPATILPILTADLQLISSNLGVNILHKIDISAYREGNIIDLGNHKLDIAVACSGLNYLFPLMSISYIIAFFSFKLWWKRGIIFISAIPITVALNGFRIALSGILYNYFGPESIQGVMHYIEGYIIFTICLLLLILLQFLLKKVAPREPKTSFVDLTFSISALKNVKWAVISKKISIVLLMIISVFGVITFTTKLTEENDIVLTRQKFNNFPLVIGNWIGSTDHLSRVELDTLKLTDHFMANYNYRNSNYAPINLYIAYYEKQTQENSVHSPEICLPSSGWIALSNEIHTIGDLKVNKEVLQKNTQSILVYYWFIEGGVEVASRLEVKKQLLLNAMKHSRTDGSLIRISRSLEDRNSIESAQSQMDDFVNNLQTIIPSYIPQPIP